MTTKLFVPAGAPLHVSAGDTFCPGHPMTFATWRVGIVAPGLMSGLVSEKRPWAPADVAPTKISAAARERLRGVVTRMATLLLVVGRVRKRMATRLRTAPPQELFASVRSSAVA